MSQLAKSKCLTLKSKQHKTFTVGRHKNNLYRDYKTGFKKQEK